MNANLGVTNTGLTLRSPNVCVVNLGSEFETGQGFGQVSLQWADHDKHECLRISAQRELKKICQLLGMLGFVLVLGKIGTWGHTLLFR